LDKEIKKPMKIKFNVNNSVEAPYARVSEKSPSGKKTEKFSEILKNDLSPQPGPQEPAGNGPIEYLVKPGDTLWKIGRHLFKKDPMQIAKENGLSNPDKIHPGQRLLIYPSSPKSGQPRENGEVIASWYGAEHHQAVTASGQRFDMNKNTLAHKTLPMGTKVRLVNPENGKTAEGVVNDRGPFIRGRDVDISYALAKKLGFVKKGVTKLKLEVV
jgi:rare lipoprotein A